MRRRWLVAVLALAVVVGPAAFGLWMIEAAFFGPLPSGDGAGFLRRLLGPDAAVADATVTADGFQDTVEYYRFRTSADTVAALVRRLGLEELPLGQKALAALRRDARMPPWWRPQQELKPGRHWRGHRDGWDYTLYFEPDSGIAYLERFNP